MNGTDEERRKLKQKKFRRFKNAVLRMEIIIGFMAIIAGIVVTAMVWGGARARFVGRLQLAIEDGKIAEHWDVMETIADKETWANENGKF